MPKKGQRKKNVQQGKHRSSKTIAPPDKNLVLGVSEPLGFLEHKIIASGSSGNCVIVGGIMFDVGVPFRDIKEDLYNIDIILITHHHSDHVKESTLKRLRMMFPNIKVLSNWAVAQRYPDLIDQIITPSKGFTYTNNGKRIKVNAIELYHDVYTLGYIVECEGQRFVYATDTYKIDVDAKIKFDKIMIEANYDPKKLEQVGHKYAVRGYDPWKNAHRHLSRKQAKDFYYSHRKDKDTEFVELHKSSRFY